MRFKVHGADPETGHDLTVELQAETLAEARGRAFALGMLVSRVEPIGDAPPPVHWDARSPATPPQTAFPHADRVVTTQRTSKQWKLVQVAGVGMIFLGVISCLSAGTLRTDGDLAGAESLMDVAALGILLGPIVWFVGWACAWWHHG